MQRIMAAVGFTSVLTLAACAEGDVPFEEAESSLDPVASSLATTGDVSARIGRASVISGAGDKLFSTEPWPNRVQPFFRSDVPTGYKPASLWGQASALSTPNGTAQPNGDLLVAASAVDKVVFQLQAENGCWRQTYSTAPGFAPPPRPPPPRADGGEFDRYCRAWSTIQEGSYSVVLTIQLEPSVAAKLNASSPVLRVSVLAGHDEKTPVVRTAGTWFQKDLAFADFSNVGGGRYVGRATMTVNPAEKELFAVDLKVASRVREPWTLKSVATFKYESYVERSERIQAADSRFSHQAGVKRGTFWELPYTPGPVNKWVAYGPYLQFKKGDWLSVATETYGAHPDPASGMCGTSNYRFPLDAKAKKDEVAFFDVSVNGRALTSRSFISKVIRKGVVEHSCMLERFANNSPFNSFLPTWVEVKNDTDRFEIRLYAKRDFGVVLKDSVIGIKTLSNAALSPTGVPKQIVDAHLGGVALLQQLGVEIL